MWEQAKALQEGAEIVVCTPVSISVFKWFSIPCNRASMVNVENSL